MTTPLQTLFAQACHDLPLVAVLRGISPTEIASVGQALYDAHWRILEVPLNSPDPYTSIHHMQKNLPDALIGAGTVLTTQHVKDVHQAGGRLIVSPHFNADVVRLAKSKGMICIPGVATPSEAFAALDAGADALKLFPAEMMPPAVIKALRAVLPKESILFPVGGISLNNMKDYKAAGASGFGIGTSLYKPGMSGNEVGRQAQAFAQTWGSLR